MLSNSFYNLAVLAIIGLQEEFDYWASLKYDSKADNYLQSFLNQCR